MILLMWILKESLYARKINELILFIININY